ncbi:hypothetical protein [Runella sp.]|uniref:hypothetical protein n=1 Tax=Runella sp. TaxID=1960881 RepID=UPI003D0C1656
MANAYKNNFLSVLLVFLSVSCISTSTDTYQIEDASQKRVFTPFVMSPRSTSYSMHIKGEINGKAELHFLLPNHDFSKGPFCSDYHEKLDSGKVDKYLGGDYFGGFERSTIYYLPCTAKKGYLTIEVAFNKNLKNR